MTDFKMNGEPPSGTTAAVSATATTSWRPVNAGPRPFRNSDEDDVLATANPSTSAFNNILRPISPDERDLSAKPPFPAWSRTGPDLGNVHVVRAAKNNTSAHGKLASNIRVSTVPAHPVSSATNGDFVRHDGPVSNGVETHHSFTKPILANGSPAPSTNGTHGPVSQRIRPSNAPPLARDRVEKVVESSQSTSASSSSAPATGKQTIPRPNGIPSVPPSTSSSVRAGRDASAKIADKSASTAVLSTQTPSSSQSQPNRRADAIPLQPHLIVSPTSAAQLLQKLPPEVSVHERESVSSSGAVQRARLEGEELRRVRGSCAEATARVARADVLTRCQQMRHHFRRLVYENEGCQEELRTLQRRLLKLTRDRNFLLDRLCAYEGASSDDSDADEAAGALGGASSDSDATVLDEVLPPRQPRFPSSFPSTSTAAGTTRVNRVRSQRTYSSAALAASSSSQGRSGTSTSASSRPPPSKKSRVGSSSGGGSGSQQKQRVRPRRPPALSTTSSQQSTSAAITSPRQSLPTAASSSSSNVAVPTTDGIGPRSDRHDQASHSTNAGPEGDELASDSLGVDSKPSASSVPIPPPNHPPSST